MLQHEQCSEKNAPPERCGLFPRHDQRQDEDAVEESIVLEVDMVNDKEARREERWTKQRRMQGALTAMGLTARIWRMSALLH